MSESRPSTAIRLILLPEGAEHRLEAANERGYLSHVVVELEEDRLYPLFFYTLERLKGELETSARQGEPYIAETGMIVVKELTLETLQAAALHLYQEGYFNYMVPFTRDQIARADPFAWPP